MKKIIATLLIAGALLMAAPVFAGSVTLTWTPPTQNSDGTPFIDLDGYYIYFGSTAGGPYPIAVRVANSTTTYVIDNLSAGEYFFVATALNLAGVESAYSNEATKIVSQVAPNAPDSLTVVDMTVFTTVKIRDGYRLIAVGTVPANTPCDSAQSVNGHYVVSADAVQWSATVRDVVVVAKCF